MDTDVARGDVVEKQPTVVSFLEKTYLFLTSGVRAFLSPLSGASSLSYLLGVFFTIFILTKYVSPIIAKLALEPIIAPLAAFGLLVGGQFETVALQKAVADNAGTITGTLGLVMIALFVQNCVKSTILIQSVRKSHRQYLEHALAGITAPLLTSLLWALAYSMEYYALVMKSAGAAIILTSTAPQIANLEITPDSLANVLNIAKYARWPLLLLVTLHLALIIFSYKWIYRGLENFFGFILGKIKPSDMLSENVKETIRSQGSLWGSKILEEYKKTPFPVDVVVLGVFAYAAKYFEVLPWYIASSIAVLILFPLSEYKRFWCEDDKKGGYFSFIGSGNEEIRGFTEEEANHRRMTRILQVTITALFLALGFVLIGNNHENLGVISFITTVACNVILPFRNVRILESAKADGRIRTK